MSLSNMSKRFVCISEALVCAFQASQPDELTIDEQEMLEVIEDGDMEDWVKVNEHTNMCVVFLSS